MPNEQILEKAGFQDLTSYAETLYPLTENGNFLSAHS